MQPILFNHLDVISFSNTNKHDCSHCVVQGFTYLLFYDLGKIGHRVGPGGVPLFVSSGIIQVQETKVSYKARASASDKWLSPKHPALVSYEWRKTSEMNQNKSAGTDKMKLSRESPKSVRCLEKKSIKLWRLEKSKP